MNTSLRTKYVELWTLVVGTMWVAVFLGSFIYQWHDAHSDAESYAVAEARAVFDRDIVFHRWASRHGGVQVPAIPPGAVYVDLDAPPSKRGPLQLLNPTELIRQMHSLSLQKNGPDGRIVSLRPQIPKNAPDSWERSALESFENGPNDEEIYEIAKVGGVPKLRYIQPIVVGESCLQCHKDQGYQVGGHQGGLSVTLSMAPYYRVMYKRIVSTGVFHLVLGLAGLGGLIWVSRRFRRHANVQETNIQRFRLFYENAPLAYQALASDGHIREVNGAWLQILGYSRAEVVGCPLASFVDPEQRDALKSWLENCRRSGQVGFVELRLRTKVGLYVKASLQSCAWQGLDEDASEIHSVVKVISSSEPPPASA